MRKEANFLADRLEGACAHYVANRGFRSGGGHLSQAASSEEAEQDVREFLELARIRLIPISAEDAATALVAFSRYGKGRGHPAQLNLGDCFAYAMAKNHRTLISFKGEDFNKTDI